MRANELAQKLAVPLGGLEKWICRFAYRGGPAQPVGQNRTEFFVKFSRSFDRATLLKTKLSRAFERLSHRNGEQTLSPKTGAERPRRPENDSCQEVSRSLGISVC